MSVVYLDANAFAKLYLEENEAEQQRVITVVEASGRVTSSAITYAEVSSVFARYFHAGKLSAATYTEKMELFAADWATTEQIGLAPTISVLAGQLLRAHRGLRGMDALHLASALQVRAVTELHFLTFDQHLKGVAQAMMPDAFQFERTQP